MRTKTTRDSMARRLDREPHLMTVPTVLALDLPAVLPVTPDEIVDVQALVLQVAFKSPQLDLVVQLENQAQAPSIQDAAEHVGIGIR